MSKKILVVDDEQDIRDYLSSYLEDEGFECRTAEDGLAAMDKVQADRPDIILLDLQMPEETGTGLYRKLHNKKELKDIPVIVISGLAGRDIAVSKSVPVFEKPIDKEGLLATIKEMLA
jgi:CheY-like chemotaxis protein